MLAGRNDVDSLAYYTKRFREFSDDGKTFNGAYGYRWRNAKPWQKTGHRPAGWSDGRGGVDPDAWETAPVDQLDAIVNHLKADPNSRRAVLQMWNVEDDLLKIGPDVPASVKKNDPWVIVDSPIEPGSKASKDVCCNISVLFSLREFRLDPDSRRPDQRILDMTVLNRSNDLVWGLLGANYVTFSILQEYVASHLGVQVGKYHHVTNNLHVYDWNWKPEEWLAEDGNSFAYMDGMLDTTTNANKVYRTSAPFRLSPLVKDPAVFDKEVGPFVEWWSKQFNDVDGASPFTEPFFDDVAYPMFAAYHLHKAKGDRDKVDTWLKRIGADDWQVACTSWLQRRRDREKVSKV